MKYYDRIRDSVFRIFAFGLLLALAISCKVTKQTMAEVQTATVAQKEVSVQTNETRADNSVIDVDANEHIVITVFSLPDSAGKQYVTSVTEIQKNKTLSGKKNIVEEKETVKLVESITQKTESVKVAENTKKETKTPGWVYVVAGILSVGIIIVIIWLLKRYKIL